VVDVARGVKGLVVGQDVRPAGRARSEPGRACEPMPASV
jgi:hypothetical protein